VLFAAPYELGTIHVRVLAADAGNNEVDNALTGPVPSSRVFLQPGDESIPLAVRTPALPKGARRLGQASRFGGWGMFLTLGQKLHRERALLTADLVAGGRQTTYTTATGACIAVNVATESASQRDYLTHALVDWARSTPKVSVATTGGNNVGFRACNTGSN